MGSFNTTCAITNTPIMEGDAARVFFLVMDAYAMNRKCAFFNHSQMGSSCYPYDHFKVIGYPMKGVYADYNRYEFDDNLEALNLKIINKIYVPNKVEEGKTLDDYNSHHDYMNIDELTCMQELQDMEHSGALRVKTWAGASAIVKMAIHESVYQMMIGGTWTKGWGDNAVSYTHASKVADAVKRYGAAANPEDALSERGKMRVEMIRAKIGEEIDGKTFTKEDAEAQVKFYIDMNSHDISTGSNDEFLIETHPKSDMADAEEDTLVGQIACAYYGARMASTWMQCNNYQFKPAVLGGQDYEMMPHANRLRELADVVEKLQREDEESVPLELRRTTAKVLKLTALKERFDSWYDESDDEYKDYLSAVRDLLDGTLKPSDAFYVVGDGSTFDKFVEGYTVLRDVEKGDVINIE